MKFHVAVEVSGLDGIADPEGQTIERALPLLGFEGIEHVRVGRMFRFDISAGDEVAARRSAEELCDRLLANPVIQTASLTVQPAGAGTGPSARSDS